ncbi:hypothetical protein BaRGS_00026272 [Batillaria attramentaria]|uniref:Uncharacterized protein n=1 Tax=Batillaria attramentaria TaxID=370345 RepID=A0ABD0K685_9CAEN
MFCVSETGDPTYFYRGCSTSDDPGQEGCHEDHVKEYCSYSCVDVDYCNDRAFLTAPSLDKGGQAAFSPGVGICWGGLLLVLLLTK